MKKLHKGILFGLIFVLPFWLLVYSALATIYYVIDLPATGCADNNAASATVDGTDYNPTDEDCNGGGSDSYYTTIADLNAAAATTAPGDTISFNKGGIWREQLTIPESGSAGNVYTYTSHGTGADPIISGADVVAGFSLVASESSIFSDGFEDGTFDAWDSVGGAAVDEESQLTGTYGAHSDFTAGLANLAGLNAGRTAQMRGSFHINAETASDGNDTCLAIMRDDGGNARAGLWITQSSGVLYVDAQANAGNGYAPANTFAITTGQTYDWILEVYTNATTGYVKLWIDADLKKTIAAQNLGTGNIARIEIGEVWNQNTILDVYHDDVSLYAMSSYADLFVVACAWNAGVIIEGGSPLAYVTWDTDAATTYAASANGSYFIDNAGDKAYIHSDDALGTIEIATREYGINFNEMDYITVDGITVDGVARHGIYGNDSTNIIIQNCTVKNTGGIISTILGNGIEFSGDSSALQILNNTIYEIFDDGITAQLYETNTDIDDVVISGGSIYNFGGYGVHLAVFDYTGCSIGATTGTLISGVDIYNGGVGFAGDQDAVGVKVYNYWDNGSYVDNTTINDMTIHDNLHDGVKVVAFDTRTVTLNRSHIYDNAEIGILHFSDTATGTNTLVGVGNVVEGNGREGLRVDVEWATGNTTLYGNTFAYNGDATYANVQFKDVGGTKLVKNNILASDDALAVKFLGTWSGSGDTDYNLYYRSAGDIVDYNGTAYDSTEWAAYKTASSQDSNSPTPADPLFTNAAGVDFSLLPNSPARHGAVYIPTFTTKLRPESTWPSGVTTMEDILSIGAYGVYRGSAGM